MNPLDTNIENVRINAADIIFDHGILSLRLTISGNNFEQVYGGAALGGSPFYDTDTHPLSRHHIQPNVAADFISGILGVAGVNAWSQLPGQIIRIRRDPDSDNVVAIGHAVFDLWYHGDERFQSLKAAHIEAIKVEAQIEAPVEEVAA